MNLLGMGSEAALRPGLVHLLWPLTAREIYTRRMVATSLNLVGTECEAPLPPE